MPLDGPLLPADWTAEINYLANSDGSMTMSLAEGDEVKVPVRPGPQPRVRAAAGRRRRDHRAGEHAALSVCVAAGPVGFVAPR